ncbi:hypothetical protein [Thermofilum pendens]|uniref:hypothetical protein n=1 Tax=Thermofilum pendens TaxID=2269 RepID=UPI000AB0A351|nr:hypothetical protein [Thermofilum pendens]
MARRAVVDLLAFFGCRHPSPGCSFNAELLDYLVRIGVTVHFVSRVQVEKYNWGSCAGEKARLLAWLRKGKELGHGAREERVAGEVVRGGVHRDEYLDLCAGVAKAFQECSADLALLCSGKTMDVDELLLKLRRVAEVELEALSFPDVYLLRKVDRRR